MSTDTRPSSVAESLPYIIHIKNLTDQKLTDVQIFDHDYKDQQKIEYTCLNAGISYGDFLRMLIGENTPKKLIGIIYAQCDKFDQFPFDLFIQKCDEYGKLIWDDVIFRIRHDQNQRTITVVHKEFFLYNQTKLKLEFLLPNNSITFRFFPPSIIL